MPNISKVRGIWALEYSCLPGCPKHPVGGQRHHPSLQTRDEKVARSVLRDFNQKYEEDRARLILDIDIVHPDPKRTISVAMEKYFGAMAVEKSSSTLKRVERPAANHLVKILGDVAIHTVGIDHITNYRTCFLRDHVPATWNSRRATFRAIWNWFLKRKWVKCNPWVDVGPATDYEDTHRMQPVDRKKLPDLLAALPDRDWQLITLFLYESLCRVGEMIQLLRTDVLRDVGVMRFRLPKERKSKQVRYKFVALTPQILAIIDEAESRCDSLYVFSRVERHGRPMKSRKVHRILSRAGHRVGVTVSPHRLRKSGSTHALASRADIKSISKALGHSDIRTTAKYTLPDIDQQRAALSSLNVDGLSEVTNGLYREKILESVRKAQAARKAAAASRRPHAKDKKTTTRQKDEERFE